MFFNCLTMVKWILASRARMTGGEVQYHINVARKRTRLPRRVKRPTDEEFASFTVVSLDR
ncbi:hypothetical protein ASF03_05920 [Rhizobium sp. Leaf68]|nr:hypothetical protein ASE62_05810 [Rhizobium sp. Leaf202]KQN85235.1 hypothetical protein ASF03_05920 [Rhizobium sp. Leaf68]